MEQALLDQEIENRIRAFIADINQLVKDSAVEAVKNALGGQLGGTTARAPAAGRGRGGRKARAAAAPKEKAATGRRGGRKPSFDIEEAKGQIISALSGGQSLGMEDLRKQLGLKPTQLRATLSKLRDDKQVVKSGDKRSTRYSLA